MGRPGMLLKATLPNADPVHEGTATEVRPPVPVTRTFMRTTVPSGRLNAKFWPAALDAVAWT